MSPVWRRDGIKYMEVMSCLFQNFYPLHATTLGTLFCDTQFEACFRGWFLPPTQNIMWGQRNQ